MLFSKISIIIPAYNAEKTIRACVNAALHQDASGISMEVIVVDDGSTDATAEILKTFDRVLYFYQANAGPAAARNHGARRASGDILFFTDADCIPQPDWIRKIMDCFISEHLDAAAGSYGISNPESLLARCVHQEILYRHQKRMGDWIEVFGSYNVAIRQEVFNRIGGFNEGYRFPSGEDNDLSYRLRQAGVRIRFVKDARVDHAHPVDVWRYLREQFRHGLWRVKMYRAFPEKIAGDGYTFWKDPLEVFLTGCLFLGFWGSLFYAGMAWGMVIFLMVWLGFEAAFAVRWQLGRVREILFFSLVMMMRSWARTAGFVWGCLTRS